MPNDDLEDELDRMSDDELMERCRAGRAILDALDGRNIEQNKDRHRYAFLSIFHPEMSHAEKLAFNRACHDDATDAGG